MRWAEILDNIAASQAARASSNFSQYIAAEGRLQEALGIWPRAPVYNTTFAVGTWVDRYG
jgi:filamentous hemagglutinin